MRDMVSVGSAALDGGLVALSGRKWQPRGMVGGFVKSRRKS